MSALALEVGADPLPVGELLQSLDALGSQATVAMILRQLVELAFLHVCRSLRHDGRAERMEAPGLEAITSEPESALFLELLDYFLAPILLDGRHCYCLQPSGVLLIHLSQLALLDECGVHFLLQVPRPHLLRL